MNRTLKRIRPRFSIRTLVTLTTLACCYAACWGPTKNRGVEDVQIGMEDSEVSVIAVAIAPLLVRTAEYSLIVSGRLTRRYHVWFFGYVAKLPYEREMEWDDPFG